MSSNKWKATVAALAVACIGGSEFVVQAQTSGTSGSVGTEGSVRAAGRGVATQQLSHADQLSSADAIVNRGNTLSQRVAQMLDDARRESDVIRVTCLNDKLTQINANLRTAQGRFTNLQRTVDTDQRNHELTVLTVLGQKLQVLDQESNQCIGQDLYETGPTKIITEIDTRALPFESDPTNPQIQTPTAPTMLGVMDASADGGATE